jgi:hypothetical protein
MIKPAQPLLSPRFLVLAGMILLAALSRLLPHPPNFTPVESMALFGGAWLLDRRLAMLLPLLTMLISDLALAALHGGLYLEHLASAPSLAVYACILLCSLLGFGLRGRVTGPRVLGYSLLGAVLFFVVTNFATWLTADALPGHTACSTGLVPCYVAAIPFFKWTLIGTLFYSALLFGGYALLCRRYPALHEARAV